MKSVCNRRCPPKRAGAVTLLAAVVLSGATRAEAGDAPFTMNAIEDAPSGRAILAGRYSAAIDKIDATRGSAISRFYAANNLCVAQVMAGERADAVESCELAVTAIREALDSLHPGLDGAVREFAYRKYLAIALSNRGVLHAVTGRPALARADFDEAAELEAGVRSPELNLARLASAAGSSASFR